MKKSALSIIIRDLGQVVLRNVASLVVLIIGSLSLILIALGDTRDGVFLASVILINIIVGILQELRARLALEKLQAKNASVFKVIRDNTSLSLYAEQIIVGDLVELNLGDQVPVDGMVSQANALECNEALLSGESKNIVKLDGDKLLAGSIIAAGKAVLKAQHGMQDSYLSKMTESLKKYKRSLSPIQHSMLRFIRLMAIVLLVLGCVQLLQAVFLGRGLTEFVRQLAAVASTVIAEGLILTSTLFFSYGAIRMSRKKVLLQQINAIESLGRMSIVCIDKTGTLTENIPSVESLLEYHADTRAILEQYVSLYSYVEPAQTAFTVALREAFKKPKNTKTHEILGFSSERKYAGFATSSDKRPVVLGAPEYFSGILPAKEARWLESQTTELAKQAKRVLAVVTAESGKLESLKSFKNPRLLGMVILSNPLKRGTHDVVDYLQKRHVQIVVVSGDNPKTVRAIARLAGIETGSKIVTGDKIDNLSDHELTKALKSRALFARILPSQKDRIVHSAKQIGLTAMVGDGANDALALKQADIGIAMFSGAAASRQIADAVLLDNSFGSIPKGVELSDSIITTLEMIACLFFSRVWAGILLLFSTLVLGMSFPFSPRNITLLNIFIIALPIALWGVWPRTRKRSVAEDSFLARTLPFSITNAALICAATLTAYIVGQQLTSNNPAMLAYLVFFIGNVAGIALIPIGLKVDKSRTQTAMILGLYLVVAVVVFLVFQSSFVSSFFGLTAVAPHQVIPAVLIAVLALVLQYIAAKATLGERLYYKVRNAYHKSAGNKKRASSK